MGPFYDEQLCYSDSMTLALAAETIQLIEIAAEVIGLGLGLIVFCAALGELGAEFIRTNI